MTMELEISDKGAEVYRLQPSGVPKKCKHRAWIRPFAHCLLNAGALMTITDEGSKEAPRCSRFSCNLTKPGDE